MEFEEGSIVWSRSTVKDKWWPSIVFHTWDAAKEAGFVPDGIAWLIECGRKVDVTDDEAQPTSGEVLNLYLGDTPEWELIHRDEEHVLPFKTNRANLCKQRLGAQMKHQFGPALAAADAIVKRQQEHSSAGAAGAAAAAAAAVAPAAKATMAHMNPKRTGVLLDFGTGTSFASFAELWDYLRHNGWGTLPGKGLASWYYFPPGSDPKMPHPVLRRDYFDSEEAVIDHVRRTGLERPAPVGAAIPRSSPPSKTRSGSNRLSGGRRRGSAPPSSPAAPSAPPPAARTKPSSSSKRKAPPSVSEGTAAAATAPPASGPPAPNAANVDAARSVSPNASAAASAPAASAAAPVNTAVAETGAAMLNGEATSNGAASTSNGGAATTVDTANPSAKKSESCAAVDVAATVGNGDGAAKLDANGRSASEETGKGRNGVSSNGGDDGHDHKDDDDDDDDDELLVVEGLDDEQPSVAMINGSSNGNDDGNGEARQDRIERGRNMEPPAVGVKRSHGRSMQVEAAHASSSRGAPNLAKEVMRQAITARRLANSPPAPSPSKKPKRACPQLPPKELARLAKKQLGTIRKLLDGSGRAYPGPCGVERPVGEIVKFVKKAHSAWMAARQASSSGVAAPRETKGGGGAMILAGPPGAGKTTSFLAAAKPSVVGATNAKTVRFVTIKCETLRTDDPNDIFSKVLTNVTASKSSMDGDRALETLLKLTEPFRFLTVFCVEDVREVLDPATLQRLLDLAYRSTSSFAVVYMMSSIDRAIAMQFEQGLLRRDCRMIHMLPCEEDRLRAILGQSLGAADADDKDGETVAGLVNKAALDTISTTVARVCGNIRVALTICEVALANRLEELEHYIAATAPEASSSRSVASPSPSPSGGGSGGGGGGGRGSGNCSPPSSPSGSSVTASVLLTVHGAKAATNVVMQR
eukprot:g5794.t1